MRQSLATSRRPSDTENLFRALPHRLPKNRKHEHMKILVVPFFPYQAGVLADAIPEFQSAMLHPFGSAFAHSDVVIEGPADSSSETRFDPVAIGPNPSFLQRRSQSN